jgi:ribonuclease D
MIDTARDLDALVDRCLTAEAVALDTEFVWERTFVPALGVVQVGLGPDDVHVVDATGIETMEPLGRLLADASVPKILHDAGQDLQILARATGARPRNVFDTQRAAGLVGLSATISLQELVQWACGVHLEKGETRTDWLRRPLSEKQVEYALDDVRYLPAVRERLIAEATARGRMDWIAAEMARYEAPEMYEPTDDMAAVDRLKVPGIGRLSGRDRAVLRHLAAWRERESRALDRTRRMVLPDEGLVDLAQRVPMTDGDLARTPLTDKQRARFGAGILAAVAEGLKAEPETAERRGRPGPEEERDAARLLVAQAFLAGRCATAGVDPALVATKAVLKEIVDAGPDAARERLTGWRADFVGDDLAALLRGDLAVRLDGPEGWPVA